MMRNRISLALAVSTLALLGGCAVGPDYQAPRAELPAAFVSAKDTAGPAANETRWWESCHDQELT